MCCAQSPNLVVDKHWRVKVTDFNLSLIDGTDQDTGPVSANNPRWLAPESIRAREFSTQSDVFSFGVRPSLRAHCLKCLPGWLGEMSSEADACFAAVLGLASLKVDTRSASPLSHSVSGLAVRSVRAWHDHSRALLSVAAGVQVILWELLTWERPWDDLGTFQVSLASGWQPLSVLCWPMALFISCSPANQPPSRDLCPYAGWSDVQDTAQTRSQLAASSA